MEHKDLVVSEQYQIRFVKEGDNWVCRWTQAEMEFHQKMMNMVIEYETNK